MRLSAVVFGALALAALCLHAQPSATPPAKEAPPAKDAAPAFDQVKSDRETLASGSLNETPSVLLGFFEKHTVSDADRAKLSTLIHDLGDEDFDRREKATIELSRFSVAAIAPLRLAQRNGDFEVNRRCDAILAKIEKVPTRALAASAARMLALSKPEGTAEVLLNYLPLAEDESIADEIRNTLAAVALRDDRKPNPSLRTALDANDALRRGAAAEALARGGDVTQRAEMRKFFDKESDKSQKLRVGFVLLTDARDKTVMPPLIDLLVDLPSEQTWRVEEALYRLAGDKAPNVSFSGDADARKKARDAWADWWRGAGKDVDLAKLSQGDVYLGYTLLIEMDIRGVGGRVMELGRDGKKLWEITNLQFPTDAIMMPDGKVLVAEQNNNRVSVRDPNRAGKEEWGETVQQPINVQRTANGNYIITTRNEIFEWGPDHKKKLFTFNRPNFDIVAGTKLRTGEYAVMTQQGQLLRIDSTGKTVKTLTVTRPNYNSTLQQLPNNKLLVTQLQQVSEIDLDTGAAGVTIKYLYATSAQKLPNGNYLFSNQNNRPYGEYNAKGELVKEIKTLDNPNNFYRTWRVKRR